MAVAKEKDTVKASESEERIEYGILVEDVFMSKDGKHCIIKGFKEGELKPITAIASVKPEKSIHMPTIGLPKLVHEWISTKGKTKGQTMYSFKVQ